MTKISASVGRKNVLTSSVRARPARPLPSTTVISKRSSASSAPSTFRVNSASPSAEVRRFFCSNSSPLFKRKMKKNELDKWTAVEGALEASLATSQKKKRSNLGTRFLRREQQSSGARRASERRNVAAALARGSQQNSFQNLNQLARSAHILLCADSTKLTSETKNGTQHKSEKTKSTPFFLNSPPPPLPRRRRRRSRACATSARPASPARPTPRPTPSRRRRTPSPGRRCGPRSTSSPSCSRAGRARGRIWTWTTSTSGSRCVREREREKRVFVCV